MAADPSLLLLDELVSGMNPTETVSHRQNPESWPSGTWGRGLAKRKRCRL